MTQPRSRRARHRRGFLLYLVVGLVAVAGILMLGLDLMARQRNRLAHRSGFNRVADGLAAGAASYLQFVMKGEVVDPAELLGDFALPLTQGSLHAFLLQPAADLESALGRTSVDALFATWFGEDWRVPIDDLEEEHPGAEVSIDLTLEAAPLHPEGAWSDPIEKTASLGLVVTAEYRGVVRTRTLGFGVKVVHPLPPVTSKFTFFVDRVPNPEREFNLFENDEAGESAGTFTQFPFVLQNTPLGLAADREIIAANAANVEAGDPWARQAEVADELRQRGYVYLGTGPGNGGRVVLNLTAGPSLRDAAGVPVRNENGEFFHLFDPERYESQPTYYRLVESAAPDNFNRKLTLPDGSTRMAFINFLFWGFHTVGSYDLEDAGLGSTLDEKRSSILHVFGNDDAPSRTMVYGPVYQNFIRLAYLATDRKVDGDDLGPDDEAIQQGNLMSAGAASGIKIRDRDAIEPIFANVPDEAAWQAELGREAGNQELQFLEPFPTLQSGLPPPENKNFALDTDDDGFKDLVLDPGHPRVTLDASIFNYANLFDDGYDQGSETSPRKGYARYMSKVMEVRYNEVTDYMFYSGVIPPEEYRGAFQGWTAGDLDEKMRADEVELDFGDPVHEFYAAQPMFRGDLSEFVSGGEFSEILARRASVRVPDSRAFFRRHQLVPDPADPSSPVRILAIDDVVLIETGGLDLPPVRVRGDGVILVKSGDLILRSVEPLGDAYPSFVALDGNLVLDGPGPFYGAYAAPKGELTNPTGLPASFQGTLTLGSVQGSTLARGGGVRYAGIADPTRYQGPARSYADLYAVEFSDAPLTWRVGP